MHGYYVNTFLLQKCHAMLYYKMQSTKWLLVQAL